MLKAKKVLVNAAAVCTILIAVSPAHAHLPHADHDTTQLLDAAEHEDRHVHNINHDHHHHHHHKHG